MTSNSDKYQCLSMFVFLTLLASCLPAVAAKSFLSGRYASVQKLETAMLRELPGSDHLRGVQEELRPMFLTLPKNEHGCLEPSSVRYALHRYFVHKHGWHVKGLAPEGESWQSNQANLTKDWAPAFIQHAFDKRLNGRGLGLEELAIFVATLSDLIFGEGVDALHVVYEALELSVDVPIEPEQMDAVLEGYMAWLTVGHEATVRSAMDIEDMVRDAMRMDPAFPDIVMWIKDKRKSRQWREGLHRNPFRDATVSFEEAAENMKDLMHHFGEMTGSECVSLKLSLIDMEQAGNGRVPLRQFYSNQELAMHESVDYLRNQGALEEGNGEPRVVIPNYITSPCRCLPFTEFFSVCCPNECEDLMGKVERALRSPSGSPSELADIVSKIPSDTVVAPRNISGVLLSRLGEIAQLHRGQIPIHGRLFAQWMHHAFPRECVFPHVSGTVKAASQAEWLDMRADVDNVLVSDDERERMIKVNHEIETNIDAIPWTDVEELVANVVHVEASHTGKWMHAVMGLMLLLSFVTPLVQASSKLRSGRSEFEAKSAVLV